MPFKKLKNGSGSATAGTVDAGEVQQDTGKLVRYNLLQEEICGNGQNQENPACLI